MMKTLLRPIDRNVNPCLEAALHAARLGLRVHPLHGTEEHRCLCGNPQCQAPGKHSILKGWQEQATADEDTIRKWWNDHPAANIGILTGVHGGIFVVDVDGEDGHNAKEELEQCYGPLPDTWESITARGRHIFFKYPDNGHIKSRVNWLPQVDIKSDGNYTVGSGSRHITAWRYEWEVGTYPDETPLANPPEWLIGLLTKRKPRQSQQGVGSRFMKVITLGIRNDTLFSEACRFRDRGHNEEEVRHHIHLRNWHDCRPPLEEGEADRILNSAFDYAKRPSAIRGHCESAEELFGFLAKKCFDGGWWEGRVEDIAKGTGLKPRTIQRQTKNLEQLGKVTVQPVSGRPNRYYCPASADPQNRPETQDIQGNPDRGVTGLQSFSYESAPTSITARDAPKPEKRGKPKLRIVR